MHSPMSVPYPKNASAPATRIVDRWAAAGRRSALLAALVVGLSAVGGCKREAQHLAEPERTLEKQAVRPARIIAQGQLLPAGGLIRLNGTPGDTVQDILVAVGDTVEAGQALVRMRSAEYRESQLETLRQQLTEAELQRGAAIDRAQIELSAARMQLAQAKEQLQSVKRREQSLSLLKQQWDDAQAALQQPKR